MLIAALISRSVSPVQWDSRLPFGVHAASSVRRFSRWLHNSGLDPHELYGKLFRYALRNWTQHPIVLALDTSMLKDRFCAVRISMIYLGRAIPVAWRIFEHDSSAVKYEDYREVLERAHSLMPREVPVIFLADRGFVHKALMRKLNRLEWEWRIRIKANQVLRCGSRRMTPQTLFLQKGNALLFDRNVHFGRELENLSLSAGWPQKNEEPWYVLSNGVVGAEVFADYALRFDIEEEFRDEKSGGFGLEETRLTDSGAIERLLLVVAAASIVAVNEGLCVMAQDRRRDVDTHWQRGLSYFQIGWRWVTKQLSRAVQEWLGDFELWAINDPLPVAPTRNESMKRRRQKDPRRLFTDIRYMETLL